MLYSVSPDKEDRESSLEKQRLEDIELLHQLGVTYINDLMVENRKVKYGLKVTSSEKVDSFGRYSDFKLVATPYPGVEFFQKFKANKYSARRLCFDWSQNFADAELQLPPGHTDNLSIRWKDYKNWDLIELTQNYLRLYLTHIADDTVDTLNGNTSGAPALPSKGLLIHCISGWDRTPLFISLLRISLWADGEAHQSLTAAEMLYLTMGYDWFLFNHLLADRSQRGEDIFYFCFYFLKFIYGEEFSLKSVSSLSKNGQSTHRPSFSTHPVSSRSLLLKDIGRHKGGELGAFTGLDTEDSHGYICDECKILRKSSNEPLGRNTGCAKSGSQDAASSNDGKPSSWQLVTFATPPGRGGQGSPRAPFMPTLQVTSRQSGSPLGATRNSYSSGFGEQTRCTNPTLNQEVLSIDDQSATSPIMKDKRFHPVAQQFNARRLSSSGIPDLFAEEAKRLAQGASGLEFSRVATSPNLQFGREPEVDPNSYESSKGDMGDRQSTPRKRASTFDGGLLLSTGQELNANADDIDPKEQEDDLTSGDDDNGDEELNAANTAVERGDRHTLPLPASNKEGPQICQMCHHSFIGGSRKPSIQDNQIPAKTGALNISQQSMEVGANQVLERVRAVDRLFPQEDTEQTCHHAQMVNEFDRDEGMFQLEIDDRPSYRPTLFSCDSKSELECLDPSCLAGPGRKDMSLNGDSCVDRTLGVRGISPAADETGSIEGDENESFWDEASSTMDYGCSPGSILNGFGTGLTQCLQDQPADIRLDRGHQADESIRDEDDDEEEDEDDDGAGSLNSRRNSLKMGCNENDRLFMPSLTGVFSNTDRSSQGSGRRGDNSILDNSFPTEDFPSPFEADTAHPLSSTAKDGLNAGPGQGANSETPKTLTRRQKLKQLRRLFMDIRNEIGDGNYSPSMTLLDGRNRSAACSNSAGENDDDSGGSFRADSFSDDHSFASSAFINRHGSTTTTTTTTAATSTSKRRDYDQGQSHFSRESSTRPDSGPRIVSPIPRSQYQQQQQNRPQNLSVPSSSGRKSPFEWAAAAASSAAASITTASGIVSGSFSQSNSPSMGLRQDPPLKSSPHNAQQQQYNSPSGSNHYRRHFALPSAQSPFQPQERQHHQYNGGNGSHMRGSASATIKSTEEFQEITSASARQPSVSGEKIGSSTNNGYGNTRRRSLATPTAASSASASKLRGNAESSGRWGDCPSPDRYHDRRGPPKDWDAPEEEEGEISYSGRHTSSSSSRGGSGNRDHRDRGYSDRRRDDRYRDSGSDRRDYRDRGDRGDRSERDYRDRERDKDRSDRDTRRRRSSRSRSRSRSPYGSRRGGGGGGRSRSRSPRSKRGRRDDDDKEDGEYRSSNKDSNKDRKGSDKKSESGKGGGADEEMTAPDELSPEDEEARMMALMGFGGFDSTKGKKVPGADVSGADIKKQRQYRQYMNRRGGFNRPLDAK
ncbi:Myotubularin- protein 14 [Entomortierella chlamydospora]|uniref:Myotubularin- protein 14 n=1 Tax=Entomortierella chlamydospora TaxID=101097 RepID=A0A9P6N1G3_9FUNG|nr:Myotubularin- protein 14 [Entomortierella chlamydospora]